MKEKAENFIVEVLEEKKVEFPVNVLAAEECWLLRCDTAEASDEVSISWLFVQSYRLRDIDSD